MPGGFFFVPSGLCGSSKGPRMKVTGLALIPPPTAAEAPRVTPELLASVLARYSRSNEGLAKILERVDLANPDETLNRIAIKRAW